MASRPPSSSSSGRPADASHRSSERQYQQDFITKIRYTNHLPPPPQPPKLLEIPNNAAIEYTSTAFVSRLAREQPQNIEIDSELGMPLDLLPFGPDIFNMNPAAANKVIYAPEIKPKPHDHDKPLLRPMSALGKPHTITSRASSGVSFLRRTEYISSEASRSNFKSTTSRELIYKMSRAATKMKDPSDPVTMLQAIITGFEIANPISKRGEEPKTWAYPKHPLKPGLRVVDSYPVLPDLSAHPDGLGYVIVKLSTNPVSSDTSRNPGLDFALLRPWNDEGAPEDSKFHYYLPDGDNVSMAVKRKYDDVDTGEDGYTQTSSEGRKFFRFKRLRAYEYVVAPEVMKDTYREVALIINDGTSDVDKPKGAYFSPIFQRNFLRPMRTKDVDEEEATKADIAEVKFRDLLAEEKERIDEQVGILTEGE